jgi:hypothetical protein
MQQRGMSHFDAPLFVKPEAKKERFFALLRMTLDQVVILNVVKDLELKMSHYQ